MRASPTGALELKEALQGRPCELLCRAAGARSTGRRGGGSGAVPTPRAPHWQQPPPPQRTGKLRRARRGKRQQGVGLGATSPGRRQSCRADATGPPGAAAGQRRTFPEQPNFLCLPKFWAPGSKQGGGCRAAAGPPPASRDRRRGRPRGPRRPAARRPRPHLGRRDRGARPALTWL